MKDQGIRRKTEAQEAEDYRLKAEGEKKTPPPLLCETPASGEQKREWNPARFMPE